MTEKEYEKRRYEIARDCLAALISTGANTEYTDTERACARESVRYADALLAELDKKK